jgi:hypothetical protein
MIRLRNLLWGALDFRLAAGATSVVVAAALIAGVRDIPTALAKDLYEVAVDVLSITFSIFFAALATLASGSDDEYMLFLQRRGLFTKVMWGFKVTLMLLFIALIVCLGAYSAAAYCVEAGAKSCGCRQSIWFGVLPLLLFLWSMLATLTAAWASIRHAETRADYLDLTRPDDPADGAA